MWYVSLLITVFFAVWYLRLVGTYAVGWQQLLAGARAAAVPTAAVPPGVPHDVPAEAPRLWPRVTVLVAARNEAHRIGPLLEALCGQDYPGEWELLVVDDRSTDGTAERVRSVGDPRFGVLERTAADGQAANKKGALTLGVAQARGEWVLCTDADCVPGPAWISSMVAAFEQPRVHFVSGPVLLAPADRLLLQMQQLEFLSLNAIGAANIALGTPNMCNGANMAYRKATFEQVGGYQGNLHLASGDDEFLMHRIAATQPGSVVFCADPRAMVRTAPEPNLPSFFSQRIRWVSKHSAYQDRRIGRTLITAWFYNFSFLPLAVLALIYGGAYAGLLALALLVKVGAEWYFLKKVVGFYGCANLQRLVPLEQLFYIPYVVLVGLGSLGGRYQWKDRKHRF